MTDRNFYFFFISLVGFTIYLIFQTVVGITSFIDQWHNSNNGYNRCIKYTQKSFLGVNYIDKEYYFQKTPCEVKVAEQSIKNFKAKFSLSSEELLMLLSDINKNKLNVQLNIDLDSKKINFIVKENKMLKKIKKRLMELRLKKDPFVPAIQTLVSEIEKIGKDNGNRETTQTEAIKVIEKSLKNIDINLKALAKNPDRNKSTVQFLLQERELLESFLPEKLDSNKIISILEKEIIELKLDPKDKKNLGVLYSFMQVNYSGQYDPKKLKIMIDIAFENIEKAKNKKEEI